MQKILICFGTRPEAIKMAPLIICFYNYKKYFNVKVCVTAQHREMLDQVLSLFEIVPDYDLNLMKDKQDLFEISSNILLNMKKVLDDFNPDLVLVHGDTTTSTFCALSAFYKKIKVGHVEAGLRTNDIYSPWPEELNRQLTSKISSYHFAPTNLAMQNLINEGIDKSKIIVTGNTVIDSLIYTKKLIENNVNTKKLIIDILKEKGYNYTSNKKRIIITAHRRENFGEGFINICEAIKEIANENEEIDFIYPVHLNPNVQKPVFDILKDIKNIFLIKPLDYLPFTFLLINSNIIITDSGGIQEESVFLGKPIILLRETTERPEVLNNKFVKLVGTDKNKIINKTSKLIKIANSENSLFCSDNVYGNGDASKIIVEALMKIFYK